MSSRLGVRHKTSRARLPAPNLATGSGSLQSILTRTIRSSIVHKVARLICVLFITSVTTLLLLDLVPGNPAYAILGQNALPAQVARIDAQLGLNKPFPERYAHWVWGILHGNFGTDSQTGLSVLG